MNRVELQNGYLALGHANLFIPSTLNGSCIDPQSGTVSLDRLRENLDLATDIYINQVNGCPCGNTVIHLYKGADSSEAQEQKPLLQIFLKGSKERKAALQRDKPNLYKFFTTIWSIRERHQVSGLPQYTFFLVCCFKKDCPHPLCQSQHLKNMTWFPAGPKLHYIPFPIPDPLRPWGNPGCDTCKGFCAGHYLKPEEALASDIPAMKKPPSSMLTDFFISLCGNTPTTNVLEDIAKKNSLPVNEVQMWLEHLKTIDQNRKHGAAKAAETRRKRCTKENYRCGFCGAPYESETEVELWIACDKCSAWFHCVCVGFL